MGRSCEHRLGSVERGLKLENGGGLSVNFDGSRMRNLLMERVGKQSFHVHHTMGGPKGMVTRSTIDSRPLVLMSFLQTETVVVTLRGYWMVNLNLFFGRETTWGGRKKKLQDGVV